MNEQLEHLEKELRDKERELLNYKTALVDFPGLKYTEISNGLMGYVSEKVNSVAVQVTCRRSCGCRAEAFAYAIPFINLAHDFSVYGTRFNIGRGCEFKSGIDPEQGWQQTMMDAGCGEAVIAKVQVYLNENPPEEFKDDDE